MLLFTDGIVEATDPNGKMYDHARLLSTLEQCGHQSTTAIRDAILSSLEGYTTDDDVTLLVVKKI